MEACSTSRLRMNRSKAIVPQHIIALRSPEPVIQASRRTAFRLIGTDYDAVLQRQGIGVVGHGRNGRRYTVDAHEAYILIIEHVREIGHNTVPDGVGVILKTSFSN